MDWKKPRHEMEKPVEEAGCCRNPGDAMMATKMAMKMGRSDIFKMYFRGGIDKMCW